MDETPLSTLIARAAVGALLLVVVDVVLWRAALEDFGTARDGWLVVVSGRMLTVAFGFALLMACIGLWAALEWRVGLRENARVALAVVMLLSVGACLLVQGPITDFVASRRGLLRCAPRDELRRGSRPANDEMLRAYVIPAATPLDVLASCSR